MSVDKLLSQAEKLLEKGKSDEALEKLKSAFQLDSNNELIANKLARVHLDLGQKKEAIEIYKLLGVRASNLGRSQKAVAMFKQGLEIDANNLDLLQRLAPECETIGKMSEAAALAQQVVGFYVARKKYLDALPSFELMARGQPGDGSLVAAWLELLIYVRNDTHLYKALVFLAGPPGLNFDEFKIGGDPTKLSAVTIASLEKLLAFYPSDPVLPYSLAWVNFKQGKKQVAFKFLLETHRRNPHFTLGLLLFARILGEENRLEEALYVFKFLKDTAPSDKSVDLRSLLQQIEAFEAKNGWLNFASGFGDEAVNLGFDQFIAKFAPPVASKVEPTSGEERGGDTAGNQNNAGEPKTNIDSVPVPEVELSGTTQESEKSMVIQFSGDATRVVELGIEEQELQEIKSPPAVALTPPPIEEEEEKEIVDTKPHEDSDKTKVFSPLELLDAERVKVIPRTPKYRKLTHLEASPLEPPLASDAEATKLLIKAPLGNSKESFQEHFGSPSKQANEEEKEKKSDPVLKEGPRETVDLGDDLLAEDTRTEEDKKPIQPKRALEIAQIKQTIDLEKKSLSTPQKKPLTTDSSVKASLDVGSQGNANQNRKERAAADRAKSMLRAAEEYLSKGNAYLARKALRIAEKLGIESDKIKDRYKQIRKKENPQSLYLQESHDQFETNQSEHENLLRDLEAAVGEEIQGADDVRTVGAALQNMRPQIDETLAGTSPSYRVDIGIAFLEMGLWNEAQLHFEQAGKADPSLMVQTNYLVAEVLFRKKDYPGSIALLKSSIAQSEMGDTDKVAYLYLLGLVYEELEQTQRSQKYFRRAAEIDVNYRSLREKLEKE